MDIKKLISLLLIMSMTTVMLAGCGGKSSGEESSTDNSTFGQTAELNTETVSQTQEEQITQESSEEITQESSEETTQESSEETTQAQTQPEKADENILVGYTSKGYEIRKINGVTYVDGVLIVNKTYSLPSDYNPGALDDEVLSAFYTMQEAAAKEGLNIYISSGFRSYARQEYLYNRYVSQDGKAEADTYSARPGHSEHQTGLCFDLNTIDETFDNTPESLWLQQHAKEYGFIIRYPKGKQNITGYIYESWHLRYLGTELATKIYNSGLTVEEYYGITSVYAD